MAPRWLYVLADATPERFGVPRITDETLDPLDPSHIHAGDVVGIGIHTSNALRGYAIGRAARAAGAFVVFGGIHATLFPEEAHERGGAHAVVKGDGDVVWEAVLDDYATGTSQPVYEGGKVEPERLRPARWDLMPSRTLHVGGGADRPRLSEALLVLFGVEDRRPAAAPARRATPSCGRSSSCGAAGFRFVALADDNFYPVTLTDLAMAQRRADKTQYRDAARAPRRALRADGPPRAASRRHGVLHADHDGSGRGSRVPRRDDARAHQGGAGRRRSGHARRV